MPIFPGLALGDKKGRVYSMYDSPLNKEPPSFETNVPVQLIASGLWGYLVLVEEPAGSPKTIVSTSLLKTIAKNYAYLV